MLFTSFAFLVFLPVVFLAYWYLFGRNVRAQNLFVLVVSYVFYGWWDWRFLGLLFASSMGDLIIGRAIENSSGPRPRKTWLTFSIIVNLGLLCTFKYFNFFMDGLHDLLLAVGLRPDLPTMRILLPVGISFYTFQSLSYTIDVYRGQLKATRDPIAFLAFVSFFPQLVAGPIERATNLLPQFLAPRLFNWDQARDGLRQMLWGFFKKIVIADACAPIVNGIFAGDVSATPGITLFFGAFFFAFQIYGDFSGYSDIAIGSARLFGIHLSRNFNYPYFSRSISEFWRRWHISLSTWFRDYVYMPLGGWRTRWGRFRNIMITFTASGFWHGANWTFIGWGALHGAYYLPEVLRDGKARRDDPELRDLPRIILTFLLVVLAWVLFRSQSLATAAAYLLYMARHALLDPGVLLLWTLRSETGWIVFMLIVEWWARRDQHALYSLPAFKGLRWSIYLVLAVIILLHVDMETEHGFIYFQF